MESFHLQEHEYIELNKLLKLLHLVDTGGEANICIDGGEVIVNGEVELRKRNKLRDGYVVEFRDRKILVKSSSLPKKKLKKNRSKREFLARLVPLSGMVTFSCPVIQNITGWRSCIIAKCRTSEKSIKSVGLGHSPS